MAPEYGATCGFFPIDGETIRYLKQTGRDEDRVALVEAYAKENGFWRDADYNPVYSSTLALDMGEIVPAISGPKRPQDYVALTASKAAFAHEMEDTFKREQGKQVAVKGEGCHRVHHILYKHIKPLRDDRRWPCGPQSARIGSEP
jgi:aconitate hydratase